MKHDILTAAATAAGDVAVRAAPARATAAPASEATHVAPAPGLLWRRIRRRVHLPKLLLALVLLAAAGYFFAPSLIFVQSEEAVTNAEVVVVRSPINGLIEGAGLSQGSRFSKGDVLARVSNRTADNSLLTDVESRARTARNRIAALEGEIAVLAPLETKLRDEFQSWITTQKSNLAYQKDQWRNQLAANEIREQTLKNDVERYRGLTALNFAAQQRLEQAQRDHRIAASDAANARLEMLRIDQDEAALERGLILRGVEDRTKTLQQLDDVTVRLALARNQLEAQRRELASLEDEHAARQEMFRRQSEAAIVAPFDGVIWKLFTGENGQVTVNHEVMEIASCDRVFVSALFKQRHLERLSPGREVSIRLIGLAEPLHGRVVRVGGHGETDSRAVAQAVRLPADKNAGLLATIELADPPPGCIVGARGVARLGR